MANPTFTPTSGPLIAAITGVTGYDFMELPILSYRGENQSSRAARQASRKSPDSTPNLLGFCYIDFE